MVKHSEFLSRNRKQHLQIIIREAVGVYLGEKECYSLLLIVLKTPLLVIWTTGLCYLTFVDQEVWVELACLD